MKNLHSTHHPSPRRKPGPIKFFPREQRRPRELIQGIPAFAGMTGDMGRAKWGAFLAHSQFHDSEP